MLPSPRLQVKLGEFLTFSGAIFGDAAVAITMQSPYNAVKDPMTGRHV
jgi:hypothetical protein